MKNSNESGARAMLYRAVGTLPTLAGVALILLFVIPVVVGLAGTIVPALGLAPTLAPGNGFMIILQDPRFISAALYSLFTGVTSTILVLLFTVATLVSLHNSRLWSWMNAVLPPLLAVPHAALAVGLVFLIAPSGAVVRLISPAVTGWTRPPDAWLVPDSLGLTLILGLVIKEVPFLLLASMAQLSQIKVTASLTIGRSLGYSPARCWSRLILPLLYPRIRLTLLVILAFNLTVVDMAVLLGPSSPPTLAVLAMSLVNDPGSRAAASAGAVLLAALVGACIFVMVVLEWLVSRVARRRRVSGARGRGVSAFRVSGKVLAVALVGTSIASVCVLVLWSVTRRWRYPDALPSEWTLDHWLLDNRALADPAVTTLSIALAAAALAMVAAVLWLELERCGRVPQIDGLWFFPLLIPQVSLLFGWQALAFWTGTDGRWLTVVYTHWLYTLPYVILILAVAWREFDPGWGHAARALGAGYWRVLFRVRMPMLVRPLCQAMAVAIAVSVAQYLPTLLMGAGRYQTLATELVTSFGGVDRRTIAALAVLQSLLPLVAFTLALLYPRWRRARLLRLNNRSVPNS